MAVYRAQDNNGPSTWYLEFPLQTLPKADAMPGSDTV